MGLTDNSVPTCTPYSMSSYISPMASTTAVTLHHCITLHSALHPALHTVREHTGPTSPTTDPGTSFSQCRKWALNFNSWQMSLARVFMFRVFWLLTLYGVRSTTNGCSIMTADYGEDYSMCIILNNYDGIAIVSCSIVLVSACDRLFKKEWMNASIISVSLKRTDTLLTCVNHMYRGLCATPRVLRRLFYQRKENNNVTQEPFSTPITKIELKPGLYSIV